MHSQVYRPEYSPEKKGEVYKNHKVVGRIHSAAVRKHLPQVVYTKRLYFARNTHACCDRHVHTETLCLGQLFSIFDNAAETKKEK